MTKISDKTIEEIEDSYNLSAELISDNQHTYKDLIVIDSLDAEIEKRGLKWMGWELVEK